MRPIKRDSYTTLELIETGLKITGGSTAYTRKKTVQLIIRTYLQAVIENVLNGYQYTFPYKLGTLCIYKEKKKVKYQLLSSNPIRFGYAHTIELTSDHLEENYCIFKPAKAFTEKLKKILRTTSKQYRSK